MYEYMHKHIYIHIYTQRVAVYIVREQCVICVYTGIKTHRHICILMGDLFLSYFKGFENLNTIKILKIFNTTLQFTR